MEIKSAAAAQFRALRAFKPKLKPAKTTKKKETPKLAEEEVETKSVAKAKPEKPKKDKKKSEKPDKAKSETEAPVALEPTNATKFMAVSPKVFRKQRDLSLVLQPAVRLPEKQRKRYICFDSTYSGLWPTSIDIPNLYTLKKTYEPMENQTLSPMSKYKVTLKVRQALSQQSAGARYVFVKRPKTPKNFLPRPKSSDRYEFVTQKESKRYEKGQKLRSVFVPKTRYQYRPRSAPKLNLQPRPKSSNRYLRKYRLQSSSSLLLSL